MTAAVLMGAVAIALLVFGSTPHVATSDAPGPELLTAPSEPDGAPPPLWDRFPSPAVMEIAAGPVTWIRLDREDARRWRRAAWWDGRQWTVTDTGVSWRRAWGDPWTPVADFPPAPPADGWWDQGLAATEDALVLHRIDREGLRLWRFDLSGWTEIEAPGPLAEPSTLRLESVTSSDESIYLSVFGGPDPAVEGSVVRVDRLGSEVIPADDPGLRDASLPIDARPPNRALVGVVGPGGNGDSLGRGLVGWDVVETDETGRTRRLRGPSTSQIDSEEWRLDLIEMPGGWVWVEERGGERGVWFDKGNGWIEIPVPFVGGSGTWSWSGARGMDHLVWQTGDRVVIADLGDLGP